MSDRPKPDRSRKVPRGRYRHFKGTEYQAVGTALHSETLEPLAVYHEPGLPQDLWARPLNSFAGESEPGVKRFTFLGERYTPEEERERQLLSFIDWVVDMAYMEGGSFARVKAELLQRFPQYEAHVRERIALLRDNRVQP